MSWTTKRLKHLCVDAGQYGVNVSAEDYASSGHRLIRTSDITEMGRLGPRDDAVFVDVPLDARHQVRDGDLLLSRSGTIGRSLLLGTLEEASTYAGYLVRFRPRPSTEPRYMAYIAASSGFQSAIQADAVTSTIQNFNAERYANITVTLPHIDEQRRIADFLDAEAIQLDRLAAIRIGQLRLITARVQSYLSRIAEALGDQHGTVKVRHVLQKIEQGWSPQCEDRTAREDEWGVVKAGCVNGGIFDATQHKTLPAGTKPQLRYRLRTGDLLMSRASGSLDFIGSTGVVPDGSPRQLLLCDKVYRLCMDRTTMTPEFVALMLGTHGVRQRIRLGTSGADGMANNLPTATVTNLPLPDVPLSEQADIVKDLHDRQDTARDAKDMLTTQLALLAERRQAIITAAVTGQIDVTTARGVSP